MILLVKKASAIGVMLIVLTSCTGPTSEPKSHSVLQDSVPYDSLRTILEAFYETDQGIREKLMASEGEEFGKIVYQMQQIDSVNQLQMKLILTEHGWLPQSKVGEKAADAIFFVVQHGGKEIIKANLPGLKKLASENEAKTTHAAMMEDRLLMYEGKKQIYGTQASGDIHGKSYIWPVKDPVQVNQLRKQAGFDLTVEENAARLDASYDPERKLAEESDRH